MDFATSARFTLEEIAHNFMTSTATKESNYDDDMNVENDVGQITLSKDLEKKIFNAIDLVFLKQLVRYLYGDISSFGDGISIVGPSNKKETVVTVVYVFLHDSIAMSPLDNVMTGVEYTTKVVPTLWH